MNFREFLNEETYKEYFAKMLKKYKVEDPSELDADAKKKFFDEVDAGWDGDEEEDEEDETNEANEANEATDLIKSDKL